MADSNESPVDDVEGAAEEALGKALAAMELAGVDLSRGGVEAGLGNLRGVIRSLDAAMAAPENADRARRGAYHLAGLMDVLGLFPRAAALAVADGVAGYADGPPTED